MHVCDRARGDCKRSPACTVYGDGNTTASLRINMLARLNDSDFCGVYINDVSAPPWPFSFFSQVRHKSHRGDFDWIQLWLMLHDTICISHLHMADWSAARSGIIEIFGAKSCFIHLNLIFFLNLTANQRTFGAHCRTFPQDAGVGRWQVLRHHVRKIRIPQFTVSSFSI